MRVRPIHFVPDLAEAVRFYQALGLEPDARSRSGHWIELTAAGGEFGLHDAAIAAEEEGREGLALNNVVRGESLSCDARADHERGEECGAQQLGEQTASKRRRVHGARSYYIDRCECY
ncbi:MAG TPA: hypothetical protein VK691_05085 [Solirubrobacteraceae bacterium]|jgi:hypothetical protein|nr:hypothetical protein [Solirubrobacteraceae bacterium]